MRLTAFRLFLAEATGVASAQAQVKKFLSTYQLLRYDHFENDEFAIMSSQEDGFHLILEEGVQKNFQILTTFIEELKGEGYERLEDMLVLPQGYLSKLFHLL